METYCWEWVEAQVARTTEAWNASAAGMAADARRYSGCEQGEHERAYDEALNEVEEDLQRAPETREAQIDRHARIVASFARFSAKAVWRPLQSLGRETFDAESS